MRAVAAGLYAVALTLWIGGLWTVGYVVAPTLFHALNDRALAGAIAGRLFSLVAYIGIICAVYLLLYRMVRFGAGSLKQAVSWIVLAMLLLTLAGEFWVQPIIAGLKEQGLPKDAVESVFRNRFAVWHGIASVFYLIVSALGAVLVWLQGRDPN